MKKNGYATMKSDTRKIIWKPFLRIYLSFSPEIGGRMIKAKRKE